MKPQHAHARPAYLVSVILPLAAVLLTLGICAARGEAAPGGAPAGHRYAASQYGAEVCFPFAQWSEYSIDNDPCYTVNAPAEDGSGEIYIGTVSNDYAHCVIPNVTEEPRRFVIHCRR